MTGTVAAILWAWGNKQKFKVKRSQTCRNRNMERIWVLDDVVELMNQCWKGPTTEILAMLNKSFLLEYSMTCSILHCFGFHENPWMIVFSSSFYRWYKILILRYLRLHIVLDLLPPALLLPLSAHSLVVCTRTPSRSLEHSLLLPGLSPPSGTGLGLTNIHG